MQGHPKKIIENPLPVPELLARAEQGDADCQYWAGIRYFQAEGLPEDPRRAMELCRLAADQGHVQAHAFVGFCYSRGIAVDRNPKSAAKWYRFAARQGYGPAQLSLGAMYLHGRGVKKSLRQALRLLKQAAAQGESEALVLLGDLHHRGVEVVRDDGRACGYYRQAVELGSAAGQYMYSKLLFSGLGVQADPLEALDWLDQSAAQGFPQALRTQGFMNSFDAFDPSSLTTGKPLIEHPIPLRRRTLIALKVLKRPCYQLMARDVYDYLREHPEDSGPGLEDVAVLVRAAAENGEPPLAIVGP